MNYRKSLLGIATLTICFVLTGCGQKHDTVETQDVVNEQASEDVTENVDQDADAGETQDVADEPVEDVAEESDAEPEETEEIEELPLAERIASSDIIIVEAGTAIDDAVRDEWMEIGESYANKKLNKYQLAEMLNAICYGFDWTDVKTANLEGLNEFITKYNNFVDGMDDVDYDMFFSIQEAVVKEENLLEAYDKTFFTNYFDGYAYQSSYENFHNYDLYCEDLENTLHQYYAKALNGTDQSLYDAMNYENIIVIPYDECADNNDFYNTKLYNSIYYMHYGINNGYQFGHVLDLDGDLYMYDLDFRSEIKIMHAVPMVINGDESSVRELLVALLDDDYNVVDVIPFNAEGDDTIFKALASMN